MADTLEHGLIDQSYFLVDLSFLFWLVLAPPARASRAGTRIQALAWGLVLIFQPLSAAYYPLDVMPPTYVFEAARASLSTPGVHWEYMAIAAGQNVLYFALAIWFFAYMYRRSRQIGQFARNEE